MSELPPNLPATNANDAPKAHLTHKQILLVFSGLMLGMFLAALDNTIVNTALNNIAGTIKGGGQSTITWVVTSYLLTSTITILLWGKLSDIYGRKRMFQLAIAVFLAASALVGLSPNMMFLVGARGLQGIGAGGIMSLAFAIIGDILSPRERGKYMGLMGAVFLVAMVVGPALGGLIVEHLHVFGVDSWRWVFYINLPLGIPALFITQAVLKLPVERRDERIDLRGFVLLALGTAAVILSLTWAGQGAPWDNSYNLRWGPGAGDASFAGTSPSGLQAILGNWLVPTLLLSGAVLLASFVASQRKVAAPLLPLRLFKSRTYSLGSGISFAVGAAMFGGFVFLPTYLQMSTGVSATSSGFLMLPLMAGMFPSLTISGQLVSKTGRYKIWPLIGLPTGAAGLAWLSTIGASSPLWYVAIGMFLLGCGIGMTMQVIVVAVQNVLEPRDLGIGTSANTFMRQMGGVFGVGLFGAYFAGRIVALSKSAVPVAIANGVPPGQVEGSLRATPEIVANFPAPLRDLIKGGFADAVAHIFLFAVPVMLAAWVLVIFLKEIPLRTARGVGGNSAAPTPGARPGTAGPQAPPTANVPLGNTSAIAAVTNGAKHNGRGPIALPPSPPVARSNPTAVRIVSRPVREALPPPPSARGEYSHEDIRRRIDAMPWPKPR